MALRVLIEEGKEKILQKKLRKSTQYRLAYRNGKYYIIRYKQVEQPNTIKQVINKTLFAKANKMAIQDMQKEGRANYWRRRARRKGYKTSMGAARAYYIEILRKRDARHSAQKIETKVIEVLSAKQKMIATEKTEGTSYEIEELRKEEIRRNLILTMIILSHIRVKVP